MANDNDKIIADRTKAFKSELKALLEKYNADINFDCSDGSDTYGICGEEMTASVDNGKTFTLTSGWGVDASDL